MVSTCITWHVRMPFDAHMLVYPFVHIHGGIGVSNVNVKLNHSLVVGLAKATIHPLLLHSGPCAMGNAVVVLGRNHIVCSLKVAKAAGGGGGGGSERRMINLIQIIIM